MIRNELLVLAVATLCLSSVPRTIAQVSGDFDGDGFDDLAVGVPNEDIGVIPGAGAVNVIYGSSSGLDSGGDQFWNQDSTGVSNHADEYDAFGFSLAVGDFDGDGFDDLAIGVPYETVGGFNYAGAVNVLYGSSSGLSASGDQFWNQDSTGVNNTAEATDLFGQSLATGDFDGDGFADLAIGVPSENFSAGSNAGAVNVLYGSPSGLSASGDQFWNQDSTGVGKNVDADDYFGWSLAAGDFDDDGFDDLAIGVPYEDIGAVLNAGAVNVLYGSSSGLSASGDQLWNQDSNSVNNLAQASDSFGWSLAAGDFDDDGFDDLAIGVPYEDIGVVVNAGAVNVLYGSSSGLTASGDQFWNQDSTGINDIAVAYDNFGTSLTAGDFDGNGFADLAVGVPGEDIGGLLSTGAVNVIYGSSSGLHASGDQHWHQDVSGIPGPAAPSNNFGQQVGSGDFDGDGFSDLAVGAPYDNVPIASNQVVTKIILSLRITHTYPDDVDILLVGPTGANAIVMSDVGGSSDANDVTIILDDAALSGLPDAGPLVSGTFRPTNAAGADAFAAPAPAPSGGSALSVFNGTNPAGAWSLYVVDDAGADSGTIAAWTLHIQTINHASGTGAITIPALGAASPYPSTVTINTVGDAGSVSVINGSSNRLKGSGSQRWHQNDPGIADVAEQGNGFGGGD